MNVNVINGSYAPVPNITDEAAVRGAKIILTCDGESVRFYSSDSPESLLGTAEVPGGVLCALDCGDTVVLMTPGGARYLVCRDGEWKLLPAIDGNPRVVFYAEPQGIIQKTTVSFSSKSGTLLSDGVMPGGAFHRQITTGLSEAYLSLSASVREGGMYLQPIIARCVFVDKCGATVAVSAPQIVGLPDLWQVTGSVSSEIVKRSDSDFTISPFSLSAKPWRLHLDLSGVRHHPHFERIAEVRVFVSEELDFYDSKALSPVRFAQTHGNSPFCTSAVAGATVGMSPITVRLKDKAAKVARQRYDYHHIATLSPTLESVLLRRPVCPEVVAVEIPGHFSAGCVARSGESVAWGDVRELAPLAPHPSEILVRGDETVVATVELLRGEEVVASTSGEAVSSSRQLRPMLFTDNADVDTVRVTFCDSGESISDAITSTNTGVCRGSIVSASFSDPVVPLASVALTGYNVTALTPASRSRSAWDFSRAHIYAFSGEGVHVVSFSPKGVYLSSSLIDNRPAIGGAVFTPEGVYASVEGGIAVFIGTSARRYHPMPENVRSLNYNPVRNLILCEGVSGKRYWVTLDGEVCEIGDMPHFVYEQNLPVKRGNGVRMVSVPVVAQSIECDAEVFADSGRENEASFCCTRAVISGKCDEPVAMRIIDGPYRRRVWLRLSGTASADMEISQAAIFNL